MYKYIKSNRNQRYLVGGSWLIDTVVVIVMDERLTHRPANPNMANGTPTVPMKRFSTNVASRWFMPARRKWKTELKLHCRARDRNTWPAADGTAMVSSTESF
jgi:hypothetical protein